MGSQKKVYRYCVDQVCDEIVFLEIVPLDKKIDIYQFKKKLKDVTREDFDWWDKNFDNNEGKEITVPELKKFLNLTEDEDVFEGSTFLVFEKDNSVYLTVKTGQLINGLSREIYLKILGF